MAGFLPVDEQGRSKWENMLRVTPSVIDFVYPWAEKDQDVI